MDVIITCVAHGGSRVRFFDCAYEDGLACVTVSVELRSTRVVATIDGIQIYADLPDFLESPVGEWRSPHHELVVSARTNEAGAVALDWRFEETDGHLGRSTASVEIWLESVDEVRRLAAELRALLPTAAAS
ncbi:DUF6228 family protein [Lentzea sp. NPDC051213]|uniref:DUF6228 family protein n=1 Tax=Lentzea sp. NPDC051213 TaxID=3364126 RepID=UPI00379AE065